MKRLARAFDYAPAVLGGIAAWAHCLFGDDRMAQWLRTNADYEPDYIA